MNPVYPVFEVEGTGVPESDRRNEHRNAVKALRQSNEAWEDATLQFQNEYQEEATRGIGLQNLLAEKEEKRKIQLENLRLQKLELQRLSHEVAEENAIIKALQEESSSLAGAAQSSQRLRAKSLLGYNRGVAGHADKVKISNLAKRDLRYFVHASDAKRESSENRPQDVPIPNVSHTSLRSADLSPGTRSPAGQLPFEDHGNFDPKKILSRDVLRQLQYSKCLKDSSLHADSDHADVDKAHMKAMVDDIGGPVFDIYDYSNAGKTMCISGFSASVKGSLGHLRTKLQTAVELDQNHAAQVKTTISDREEVCLDQYARLKYEVGKHQDLKGRHFERIRELEKLQTSMQHDRVKLLDLQRKSGEMTSQSFSMRRQKLHTMLKAWRMLIVGDRIENLRFSKSGAHIKRILNKGKCLVESKLDGDLLTVEPWRAAVFKPRTAPQERPLNENLQLEYVYGYRGHDCRGNIFRLRSGEAVYSAASLGLVYDFENNAQHIYSNHESTSIGCVALHPDGLTIATANATSSTTNRPLVYVWSLLDGAVNHISAIFGEVIDCVACLSFSKDGRHLIVVGGSWPSFSLVVYDWDSMPSKLVAHSRIGSNEVLSVACNPYSDVIITCGLETLQIWSPVSVQKEKFRFRVGTCRWRIKAQTVFKKSETVSKNIAAVPLCLIERCLQDSIKLKELGRPLAAIAEIECGISCSDSFTSLLDEQVLDKEHGYNGFDVVQARKSVAVIRSELLQLREQCENIQDHQTRYARSYDLDDEMQVLLEELKESFLGISLDDDKEDGTETLKWEIEEVEKEWEAIVELDRQKGLFCEDCVAKAPTGKSVWKSQNRSPYLDKMQTLLCVCFSGPTSFVTGGEDGSILFWGAGQVISVTPLHEGCIFDMSIDVPIGRERIEMSYSLVTAGNDCTIRLSRCVDVNLIQQRCISLNGPVVSISNFFGSQKLCGLPVTRFNKAVDKDRALNAFEGLSSLESSSFQNLVFIAGTAENSLYLIDLHNVELRSVEIVCGHKHGCISAICCNPKKGDEFISFGEDGLVRLWSSKSKRALQYWDLNTVTVAPHEVQDSNLKISVSCADWSQDGSLIAMGLKSGHLIFLESFEIKEHVSCEFEVHVQTLPKQSVASRFSVSHVSESALNAQLRTKRQELIEEKKKHLDIIEKQEKEGRDISTVHLQEYDKVVERLRALDDKMESKIRTQFHGMQVIPFAVSVVNRNRLKIESLLEIQRTRGELRPEEHAELLEEVKLRKKLRSEMTTVVKATHDPETQTVMLEVDPPLKDAAVIGQKMNLQRYSFRIPGFESKVSAIKISPDRKFLVISGCSDAEIRIVTKPYELVSKLKGYNGSLLTLDWAADSRHIQASSSSSELKFWKLQRPEGKWETASIKSREIADAQWATWTCAMGWAVQGLPYEWQDRLSLKVDRSNWQKDLMVVGHINGVIDLCRFPSCDAKAEKKKYSGHSAPITAVRFLMQDQQIITGAAGDLALLQWRVTAEDVMKRSHGETEQRVLAKNLIAHGDTISTEVEKCAVCLRKQDDSIRSDATESSVVLSMILTFLIPESDTTDEPFLEDCLADMLGCKSTTELKVLGFAFVKPLELEVRLQVSDRYFMDAMDLMGQTIQVNGRQLFRVQNTILDHEEKGLETAISYSLDASIVPPSRSDQSDPSFHEETAPNMNLSVQHIFGYRGHDRKGNVLVLGTGEVLYWNACNGIISDPKNKKQRIFNDHKYDVTCSALHPDGITVGSADSSNIKIWDSIGLCSYAHLNGSRNASISNLAFSRCGNLLAVMVFEGLHRLTVYHWKRRIVLASSLSDKCSAVIALGWNDQVFDRSMHQIVTTGEDHIHFWNLLHIVCSSRGCIKVVKEECELDAKNIKSWELAKVSGDFKTVANVQPLTCVGFLGINTVITGTMNGAIYIWEGSSLTTIVQAHTGPVFGLCVNSFCHSLVSCGHDGSIKMWSSKLESVLTVIVHLQLLEIDQKPRTICYLALTPAATLNQIRNYIADICSESDHEFIALAKGSFIFVDGGLSIISLAREQEFTADKLTSFLGILMNEDEKGYDAFGFIQHVQADPVGIHAVGWRRGTLAFGTDSNALYCFDDLRECLYKHASPLNDGSSANENFCALATHPTLPIFISAASSNILQLWDLNELRMRRRYNAGAKVFDLDYSPDGEYLAVATAGGCLIYTATRMHHIHTIYYRPERSADAVCVKFSPSSHYLAIGTTDATIDIFDADGRYKLAKWIGKRIGFVPDAGGLEYDLDDGVVLCHLIERLSEEYRNRIDHTRILKLRHYKLETERIPSQRACRHRPSSRDESIALLSEGFALAEKAARESKLPLESTLTLMRNGQIGSIPWITSEVSRSKSEKNSARQKSFESDLVFALEKEKRILDWLELLNSTHLNALDFYKRNAVDKSYLFQVLRFLKSIETRKAAKLESKLETQRLLEKQQFVLVERELVLKKAINDSKAEIKKLQGQQSKASAELSNAFTTATLQRSMEVIVERRKKAEKELSTIEGQEAKLTQKITVDKQKIKRSKEHVFTLLRCCRGSGGHTGPIAEIDWSKDGLVVQSTSHSRCELRFWSTLTGERISPTDVRNQGWLTHQCKLGWAVKGLMSLQMADGKGYFSCPEKLENRITSSMPGNPCTEVIAVGEESGRVLLLTYPFHWTTCRLLFVMHQEFVKDIEFQRISSDIIPLFLEPLCGSIRASKRRMQIEQTSPTVILVKVGPCMAGDADTRCSLQIAAEIMLALERPSSHERDPTSWLRYIVDVQGPFQAPARTHTSRIARIRHSQPENVLISAGRYDRVVSIWRIMPESNTQKGHLHQCKVKASRVARAALKAIAIGQGKCIVRCLEDLVDCFISVSGCQRSLEFNDRAVLIRRQVEHMTAGQIHSELTQRGMDTKGVFEKTELVDMLCTAKYNVSTMKVEEVKDELKSYKVSSAGILERHELNHLLSKTRELRNNSAVVAQKQENLQASIIRKQQNAEPINVSKHYSAQNVGNLFDAVIAFDKDSAKALEILSEMDGISMLLNRHRSDLIDGCIKEKNFYQEAHEHGFRNPDHLDARFVEDNTIAPCPRDYLRRGGIFYDAAMRAIGGSLVPDMNFTFLQGPGRVYQYVRYNEKNVFVDELVEQFSFNVGAKPEIHHIHGFKQIRWGQVFHAKQDELYIQATSRDRGVSCSTALTYEAAYSSPRHPCDNQTVESIKKLFFATDQLRTGLVDRAGFCKGLKSNQRLAEELGISFQPKTLLDAFCSSLFCHEKPGKEGWIDLQDWIDFMLPNVNKSLHAEFKVEIVSVESSIRIGLCLELREPAGSASLLHFARCLRPASSSFAEQ